MARKPTAPGARDTAHGGGAAWAEDVDPLTLVPWVRNPKRIAEAAVAKLAKAIGSIGWGAPILARRSDRRIIAGHRRQRAALVLLERGELPGGMVPVRWVDVDDERAAAMALADQRHAEDSEWDEAALGDVLSGLEGELRELAGWTDREKHALDRLVASTRTTPLTQAEPASKGEPASRRGDVYQLGPHRLICGDCTNAAVWDALLGGDRPVLCLTDPPYGVGLDYGEGYTDTQEALQELAAHWLPIARERAPCVVFSPGVTNQWVYPLPDWVICWFYGGGQLRSPWGFNCWQPFLCYGSEPGLSSGNGARPDAVDMNTPSNAADIDHPCPKPLPLWDWFIARLVFVPDAVVVDPFGGSGTTLIACARAGHRAMLIEQDPGYCDVVRRRWTTWAREAGVDAGPHALE